MNRRTFVFNTAIGSLHLGLLGIPLSAFEARQGAPAQSLKIDIQAPEVPLTPLGMPGLFPGRVVQTSHAGAVVDDRVSQPAVRAMLEQGMRALTGEQAAKDAWAKFIVPTDVVALKVNPSGAPRTTTSIALVREVIRALNDVGVPNRNIILFDRNSNQLEVIGYHNLVPIGVRVVGLDGGWIVGDEKRTGYDPNVFAEMNCFGERETRSYMGTVVSAEATKIINLPVLKEHNASGVTGCLKNLAYGCFNNVARTHRFPKTYTDPAIPVLCTAAPLRAKAVLHIMDGVRAVYHSGPFAWNPEFVWDAKTLLIGTDPVAIDRIELEIVERKRREVGAPSLWDRNPEHLGSAADMERTAQKNRFYREPAHIRTASQLGLGRWELEQIDHRRLQVS
jgi:uncharacterized protein (DUF362 family)